MKIFDWSDEKNEWLQKNRGIDFEEIVFYLAEEGHLLDVISSPNHPGQMMFVLEVNSYVYIVPFVETDDEVFLKTIFPSRKATHYYLNL